MTGPDSYHDLPRAGWHPTSDELVNDPALLKADLDHAQAEIARLRARLRETNNTTQNVDTSVLAEAYTLVHGDRRDAYDHPTRNFERIGRMWGAILGVDDIAPADVGLCMVAVKLAREAFHPKRDNLTDIAGYAETVSLIRAEAAR